MKGKHRHIPPPRLPEGGTVPAAQRSPRSAPIPSLARDAARPTRLHVPSARTWAARTPLRPLPSGASFKECFGCYSLLKAITTRRGENWKTGIHPRCREYALGRLLLRAPCGVTCQPHGKVSSGPAVSRGGCWRHEPTLGPLCTYSRGATVVFSNAPTNLLPLFPDEDMRWARTRAADQFQVQPSPGAGRSHRHASRLSPQS